jgi:hypothetical protein
VVGSFCPQLAALLAGLPADTEEQLTGTLKQLADNIAQHGQQVRRMQGPGAWQQQHRPAHASLCHQLLLYVHDMQAAPASG